MYEQYVKNKTTFLKNKNHNFTQVKYGTYQRWTMYTKNTTN